MGLCLVCFVVSSHRSERSGARFGKLTAPRKIEGRTAEWPPARLSAVAQPGGRLAPRSPDGYLQMNRLIEHSRSPVGLSSSPGIV